MKKKDVRDRLFKITSNFSESQREKPLDASEKWQQPEPAEKQESKFSNKREHPRKNASVYTIFETKKGDFRDFTKNVSAGGILIEPETTLPLHENLFMTFFHKNLNFPARTSGKVVRIDPDGVGIQFNQVIPAMSSL